MQKDELILVTGAAGFIGFHTVKYLIKNGYKVIGVDNLNDYYDVNLKVSRLKQLQKIINASKRFQFVKLDISNRESVDKCFQEHHISSVIHLAAQAGVRFSLTDPYAYVKSNIDGFLNILENSRHCKIKHLTYASTSSVYGANTKIPFKESDTADHPLQFYAATKRANELMAHSYSHLYGIPSSGVRFFTVYGPWGRPDMALFLFTKNIIEGKSIDVFNHGNHTRDFTFVEDIVNGLIKIHEKPPVNQESFNVMEPDKSSAPFRIVNIGNNNPTKLLDYISAIEIKLNKKAEVNLLPLQPGDVKDTYADVNKLIDEFEYEPSVSVVEGVGKFIDWYIDYYDIKS
jgi:UDP-glucuronate 4-epimerase